MLNISHCINFTPRPNKKFKEPDEKEQQEVALPLDFCEYAYIHGCCSYNTDISLFIRTEATDYYRRCNRDGGYRSTQSRPDSSLAQRKA
jgi:hypothetical protein